MTRFQITFGALILAQAAHSIEEYRGRLWESFPPARFLTGLISPDLRKGFLIINILLLGFGIWCFAWPALRRWKVAIALAWLWVGIEFVNGVAHLLWSLTQFGYTPGIVTAPVLLILAVCLAAQLRSTRQPAA
jgi:Protein of unknown function with HXXEE motif